MKERMDAMGNALQYRNEEIEMLKQRTGGSPVESPAIREGLQIIKRGEGIVFWINFSRRHCVLDKFNQR